ncbi:MAG: lactate utilization protein [Desulfovibrio sp.]|jgi:L-lactate dehydrogenase complex protein LldG|nr:lactate utilization protein [Desulfovibrio sp.]
MSPGDSVKTTVVDTFRAKAEAVNAIVQEVPSKAAALQYIVDVCASKSPAEILADEPDAEQGPPGPNNMPTRVKRIVAAPELDDADFATLSAACEAKGFICLRNGLRKHLAGIDVGVSTGILGVAASGTCMVNCDKEDVRLAGMICEIHVVFLRKSTIHPDLPSIASQLRQRIGEGVTYTTLISGPSRTADIERVAAVGVHGPLELHVILLED